MQSFTELPLSPVFAHNLTRNNLLRPTPVQAAAIPPALAGDDIVATANTGTGKTVAYVLPVLESLYNQTAPSSGIESLVLAPTRELAIQVGEIFKKLAARTHIRATVVVGGVGEQPQIEAIRRGSQVVVATPGRLWDLLQRKLVRLGSVRLLVLDEADRMLDMGFLPTIRKILATLPRERQTMFFSATIGPSVANLIDTFVKDPVRIAIGSATKPAEHIDLHVYEVEQQGKLSLLEKMLREETGSFLVFARTKRGAEKLATKLIRGGAKATSIHGDRSQSQRNRALRAFQQGECRVLVATDVAARGIHVEGIAHVVNYDLPQASEDFIHRVGRTGRAGLRGTASTFGTAAERTEIRKIERMLNIRLIRRSTHPRSQVHEPVAG